MGSHHPDLLSDVNKARTLKAKATVSRPRPSLLGMKLVLFRHERPMGDHGN